VGAETDAPLIPDRESPTGFRPTVSGTKVMAFHNLPVPTPYEAIYVGFIDDRVVDKACHTKHPKKGAASIFID
jgi:hypothetical protein